MSRSNIVRMSAKLLIISIKIDAHVSSNWEYPSQMLKVQSATKVSLWLTILTSKYSRQRKKEKNTHTINYMGCWTRFTLFTGLEYISFGNNSMCLDLCAKSKRNVTIRKHWVAICGYVWNPLFCTFKSFKMFALKANSHYEQNDPSMKINRLYTKQNQLIRKS